MITTEQRLFECEALPHLPMLRRLARGLTRSPVDAEDLVQETCLRAFRSIDRYRPGTDARAWLSTIMRRARIDGLRRMRCRIRTTSLIDDGPGTPPGPETRHVGQEAIARAVSRIPEVFRTAVLLRDLSELSYLEISGFLDVPPGTVMSRIHRGRTLLRQALSEERVLGSPGRS